MAAADTATIHIRRGMDIRLEGAPAPEITETANVPVVTVYPHEFPGIKPRPHVKEGDAVKRGSLLFIDKKQPAFRFRSPAGGTIRSIVYGERRALSAIVMDVAEDEPVERFARYTPSQVAALTRDQVLQHLLDTGFLACIRQRPFSGIADPGAKPKSIFVNAMNTAPFQADFEVVVQGEMPAFQMGLDVLTRLTEGKVHLCVAAAASDAVRGARGVDVHTFSGPHPAGNTSVHIHHIDPIKPGDVVWTARAADVLQIGHVLLKGEIPSTHVIAVGGPGVRKEGRRHFRVRVGSPLSNVLQGRLAEGELRIISGDVLSGTIVRPDDSIRFYDTSFTVVPEGRKRRFLGWMTPGLDRFSHSRLFLSRWFRRDAAWALDTNENGSHRAMVLTGLYDRFLPMRIKVDYLVRAVLAHDTEEAVQLGLLETDPEDFALCAFACPSKMDLVGIIRKGLAEVQSEGL